MKNVILLSLFQGNGGIASWSKKFVKTFTSGEYKIIPIDRTVTGRKQEDWNVVRRAAAGLSQVKQILPAVKAAIQDNDAQLLHTTTSGSLGTWRDYCVGRLCRKLGVKCIMHCHYGCITEDLHRPLYGRFLRKTMAMYDQVWVLDNRSARAMRQYGELAGRVHVTPNSIAVSPSLKIEPKSYRHVAFIANLVPTKGLFELVEAFVRLGRDDMRLSIVGTGPDGVVNRVKQAAGEKLGKTVFMLGRLPNDKAVEFMKTVDILALPTYMSHEAFPISILEAMSLGKLVISTRRAAIGDMLTGLDGNPCGVFVGEKSVDDIVKALDWCVNNTREADELCKKAYKKVYDCYRMEVVYDLYKKHYDELV